MIAINLQTSFLTPPFGFALFYLRGVAPATVTTAQIYRGAMPFVGIQVLALLILASFPGLVTWLPEMLYGR
jgi:TRAP-type mannitol/chloroaromatic compound transport system permease large subunit